MLVQTEALNTGSDSPSPQSQVQESQVQDSPPAPFESREASLRAILSDASDDGEDGRQEEDTEDAPLAPGEDSALESRDGDASKPEPKTEAAVPYDRFKERNEKAKQYEAIEEAARAKYGVGSLDELMQGLEAAQVAETQRQEQARQQAEEAKIQETIAAEVNYVRENYGDELAKRQEEILTIAHRAELAQQRAERQQVANDHRAAVDASFETLKADYPASLHAEVRGLLAGTPPNLVPVLAGKLSLLAKAVKADATVSYAADKDKQAARGPAPAGSNSQGVPVSGGKTPAPDTRKSWQKPLTELLAQEGRRRG